MPEIEITCTALVWSGKYDEEGNLVQVERVNLPFQVIEDYPGGAPFPSCVWFLVAPGRVTTRRRLCRRV